MTIPNTPAVEIAAYGQSANDVVTKLETHPQRGVAQKEASLRPTLHGRNELTAEPLSPGWMRFLAQFRDIVIVLLLIAAVVSAGLWLLEREAALPYEPLAIFAVVLLNAFMGFVQQSRAEQAVLALRRMSVATSTVVRDGARSRTSRPRWCWAMSFSSKRAISYLQMRA